MTMQRIYPGAEYVPIPEAEGQQAIVPVLVIYHTIVGAAAGAENMMRGDWPGESHFVLPFTKPGRQLVPLDRRADCNWQVNSWRTPIPLVMADGRILPVGTMCGAISIETEDDGTPEDTEWTPEQFEWLARFTAWAHDEHGIPLATPATPFHPGVGYHSLPGKNTLAIWDKPGAVPPYGTMLDKSGRVVNIYNPWTNTVGKAVSLDTVIPTPTGFITMGQIGIGDTVFDHAGRQCQVTGVFDRMPERAYSVQLENGPTIRADADHNWLVLDRTEMQQNVYGRGPTPSSPNRVQRPRLHDFPDDWPSWTRVRTTDEVRELPGRVGIPTTKPLDIDECPLPLDPYLFGMWLGDGTAVRGEITCHIDEAPALREVIVGAGYEIGAEPQHGNAVSIRAKGLGTTLRSLGVLRNKHVPDTYLFASADQRLALLQGLMDSDGFCAKNGTCQFTNTNDRLATAVLWLLSSLGVRASKTEGTARLNGVDHGPQYDVSFTTSLPVFRLARKLARQPASTTTRAKQWMIARIDPIPPEPMRCITVDSPDHTYLMTEHCVVTHNSCPGAARIAQFPAVLDLARRYAGQLAPDPQPLPLEDDMPRLIQPANDAAVFLLDGLQCSWVRDGNVLADLLSAGIVPATAATRVTRRSLGAFVLVGPAPAYGPTPANQPERTTPSDFAGHRPNG